MSVLVSVLRERVNFDPSNKKHTELFRNFLVDHKWENGCPFELEWPYLSIPDMIKDRIINYYLKIN